MKAALALLLSVPGLFAASPPVKPEPAVAANPPNPVSEALCGRESSHRDRAGELDRLNPTNLPNIWRKSTVEDLNLWLKAPTCRDATSTEVEQFEHRRKALEQLQVQIERAHTTELVEAALVHLRDRQPKPDKWPTDSECPGCATLRTTAIRLTEAAASRRPKRKQGEDSGIGARLDAAAKREPQITEICAAKPSRSARAEIEKNFLYYSWTAGGAWLLEIASFFERPEVISGCLGQ